MIDLDELQKLAENAKLGSHGQWLHDQGHVMLPDEPGNDWDGEIVTQPARQVDAEFIAAANPQVVLELIERVRRVEAEREAALARIAELEDTLAQLEAHLEANTLKDNAYWDMEDRAVIAEARIAEAAKHTAAVLNRLDEMNNGQISYEVYSELHDLVALGLNEGENE